MLMTTGGSFAADWPQWRGPNRDGISKETGLMKEWPKDGPKLLWQQTDLGDGYSTPAIVGRRLYVLSNKGNDNEFVQARDIKDGKEIWTTPLGKVGNPNQQPSYPAARSTPTVEGDFLYALGSDGDLACLEIDKGTVRWRKNLRADFNGKPGIWAYSESPLIDADSLVVTPGGAEATLVSLNKKMGETIWKCPLPEGGEAAYASAIVVEAAGAKQIVQLLQKGLVGVDAKTGKFLWRFSKPISQFNANIPTPVAADSLVYASSAGTGGGAVRLSAKEGGVEAQQVYFDAKMPTTIGGTVKIGDYLFGTTGQGMVCIEFATGTVKWQERTLGPSAICYADGCLYVHTENGEVALVKASPEAYVEKGRFTPPERPKRAVQGEKSWAYPALSDGRLYIRERGSLWCYAVK
jgi:outer membrane protein assembly factor BamB